MGKGMQNGFFGNLMLKSRRFKGYSLVHGLSIPQKGVFANV
jgi:hypothetical protein